MIDKKIINYWVTHEGYTRTEFIITKDRACTYVCTNDINSSYRACRHVRKKEIWEDGDKIQEIHNIYVFEEDETKFKDQLVLYYLKKESKIKTIINQIKQSIYYDKK